MIDNEYDLQLISNFLLLNLYDSTPLPDVAELGDEIQLIVTVTLKVIATAWTTLLN